MLNQFIERLARGLQIGDWSEGSALLRRRGYAVDDHWLTTREQTDAFKAKHQVKTTPQTFINGTRIGGYEDLWRYFGMPVRDPEAVSYVPVLAVFATAAALAVAASISALGTPWTVGTAEWFIAFSMMILAMLKLQDLDRFATMFLGYDLLAQRWLPYAYAYPFLEWAAGSLMAAHRLNWLSIPVAGFIGLIGTVSVIYAVYVQQRDLKMRLRGGNQPGPVGVCVVERERRDGRDGWLDVCPCDVDQEFVC